MLLKHTAWTLVKDLACEFLYQIINEIVFGSHAFFFILYDLFE